MTDQENQQSPEASRTPDPEATSPASGPAASPGTASAPDEGSGRFAVYDKTHLRFVGPVHNSEAKASKFAKSKDLNQKHDYEVREV